MTQKIKVIIMSGAEDGSTRVFDSKNGDGIFRENKWTLGIGRKDDNDLCLRNDTFVSRQHANLHWMEGRWWLEDCNSTNGSFIENEESFFEDQRVKGIIPVKAGQLLRVGRTWLRLEEAE
ncbi:MAG: FHA domain-containing protein [Chloroflexi bacterium]|nr:MAG: FHA domain-containing protein [Chloroflexota bacterium]